eukprot:4168930-Amphidinium_carterae.1
MAQALAGIKQVTLIRTKRNDGACDSFWSRVLKHMRTGVHRTTTDHVIATLFFSTYHAVHPPCRGA